MILPDKIPAKSPSAKQISTANQEKTPAPHMIPNIELRPASDGDMPRAIDAEAEL